MQLNIRSLKKHRDELMNLVSKNKIEVIMLCETNLNDKYIVNFQLFEIVEKRRKIQGGGVRIMMNKLIKLKIKKKLHQLKQLE
jgi:hypothetical protein